MVKIIDAIRDAIAGHRHFFGLEFFVPVTEAGTQNLYHRMERMSGFSPLFCAVTWGDRGSTAEASIAIAATGQSLLALTMQVNVTGYTSTPDEMRDWLRTLKQRGIHNLFVMRGNPVGPAKDGVVHFPHAVDLVRFIRAEFGDYFGIAVAGFPEGHEDCPDADASLEFLKAKVDAGADLIITQMVFDASVFIKYCSDCRAKGITCPIIPGIMPINSYAQFRNWARGCPAGTKQIEERLQPFRNDDGEVKRIGVEVTQQLLKSLFRSGVRGVYFFTMNMEAAVSQILEGMDLIPSHRELPWKQSIDEQRRRKESSRPIHWAGRATSYLAKTIGWDEFPNGRWSDTQSPAYGEDTHYHTRMLLESRAKRCPQFASVASVPDVATIFLQFLEGNGVLPWADELSGEAQMLMENVLRPLNARGLFTINSQPAVNGVSSTNHIVGWGPKGGYVYQKEYLEFFCSSSDAQVVCDTFDKYPSLTYMARDAHGRLVRTNWTNGACCRGGQQESGSDGGGTDGGVTTVTWGIFPNREILQPTVVSMESFATWTPEAFDLWTAPFTASSLEIPPVIESIRTSWLLVNVVDNEFTTQPPLERAVGELCGKIAPLVPLPTTTSPTLAAAATGSPASVSPGVPPTTTPASAAATLTPTSLGASTVAFGVTSSLSHNSTVASTPPIASATSGVVPTGKKAYKRCYSVEDVHEIMSSMKSTAPPLAGPGHS